MFTPLASLTGNSIYEVNVRQFTASGTLNDFALHLPRLREMGVDILWFMPLTPISFVERKGTLGSYYAVSNYTAINPEFGTILDFRSLVAQAHQFGFKVIVDWVANHTGWDHTWTVQHPEFYLKNHEGQFYEKHGWEDVIDLDYTNHVMRNAMIDSMKYWIDTFDIDGFRCDMAMLVPLDFWNSARNTLDKSKPLIWLAECEDPQYFEVFDMLYAWEWMHHTKSVFQGHANKQSLAALLNQYISRKKTSRRHLYFTSNHDENSWNGSEYERYGEAALLFAALSCLIPDSIPLIYSGQELPLHRRLKFFDKDEIGFNAESPSLQDWYKKLLGLRHNTPWYKSHDHAPFMLNALTDDERIFSIHIGEGKAQNIIAFFNLSNQAALFYLRTEGLSKKYKNVLSDSLIEPLYEREVNLKGYDFRIYQENN